MSFKIAFLFVAMIDMSILRRAGCQQSRSPSAVSPAQSPSLSCSQPKASPLRQVATADTQEQEEAEMLPPPAKRRRLASYSSDGSRSRCISDQVSLRFNSVLTEVIFHF